jgi:AraC-like DNA-binding protein
VEDYARILGYSGRTLARATLANSGLSAKEFIDRRVVLEAKRLLAHGEETAARISDHLGFVTASQFSKYFAQRTGRSPIEFRREIRGLAASESDGGRQRTGTADGPGAPAAQEPAVPPSR